jgi:hypothetical protein
MACTTDMFAAEVDKVGADRVGAITTDAAPVMTAARRELVKRPQYAHILNIRCMMHGFALVMGSVMGHPFAASIVKDAQAIVTYFRASHRPLALLYEAASELSIIGALETSNKTRFTSVHRCLASVAKLEPAFKRMLNKHPRLLEGCTVVPGILNSRLFWTKLEALCKLLEPFSRVIGGVQGDATTLADVTRYWLYLAQDLLELLQSQVVECFSDEYKQHIGMSYNMRVNQLDTVLSRLALFLDPRYKLAADAPLKYKELVQQVSGST